MMRYDLVTNKLNEARKKGVEFGLIERFSEASRGVGDSKQLQIVETWKILASVVGEKDVVNGEFQKNPLKEGVYFRPYNLTEEVDIEAIELRKMFVKGAKSSLESQSVFSTTFFCPRADN